MDKSEKDTNRRRFLQRCQHLCCFVVLFCEFSSFCLWFSNDLTDWTPPTWTRLDTPKSLEIVLQKRVVWCRGTKLSELSCTRENAVFFLLPTFAQVPLHSTHCRMQPLPQKDCWSYLTKSHCSWIPNKAQKMYPLKGRALASASISHVSCL